MSMTAADIASKAVLDKLVSKLGQEVIISYVSTIKLTGGKKNPQLGRITKVVENLLVTLSGNGGEYAKRMRETVDQNFVPKARPWGVRTANGLIEHNGELYLEFIVEGRGNTKYLLDGLPIDEKSIVGLPKATINEKEHETGIVLRCIKVASLISVE